MEIVRKEEEGDDEEEEELKTILFYQFEYIPNQTPKILELKKMESNWTWIKHSESQLKLISSLLQYQNEAWDGKVDVGWHIQSDCASQKNSATSLETVACEFPAPPVTSRPPVYGLTAAAVFITSNSLRMSSS
ncbi:PREDICTED: uncharacterized protein LOC105111783 [Populus euphratica]|uniref:Uncharacterized protein LOC105111783 n=1 Tax=Populus euphratica TaxID=75702 RepID=A0AAJ6X4X3_POPEU|nr:PREDICTED: uncharacterized protein LOC105111783 [Populus euphratica]